MAEFHFIRTAWLLALIPYLVILWLLIKSKLAQGNWSRICDAELLPFILQDKAVTRSRWPLTTAAIAGFLAIIAIAGPTWERLPSPVFRNISALVIALDLSRSMDAADIKPSRLIRARYKIADILAQRKDGQTALLVYTNDAFTVTPLTDDTETINSQLKALSTSIMPSQGSNTQIALQQAVALLHQSGLNQGDILLVSDDANLDQVEDELGNLGAFRLSVLAVGTPEGAPIKLKKGDFLKNRQGEIVIPKLDIAVLRKIAAMGGGYFQLLTNDSRDIDNLTAFIDQRTETGDQQSSDLLLDQWQEQGPWLLLLILPLAALSFRRGILSVAVILLLPMPQDSYAMEWQDLWQTANQQGQQQYQQQQYEQAAQQFTDPEWQAAAQYQAGQYEQALGSLENVDSADAWYNKGNALARSGQLQAAIDAYDKSLALDSENEDAQYNKKLVEKAKQEQEQQDQQQSDQDSDQSENQEQSDSSQSSENNQDQSEQEQNQQESGEQDQQEQDSPKQQSENTDEEGSQAEQSETNPEEDESAEAKQAQPAKPESMDESKQASEQWLNRIPDDPAGLLRRKFEYQYGQRKNRTNSEQNW